MRTLFGALQAQRKSAEIGWGHDPEISMTAGAHPAQAERFVRPRARSCGPAG